MSGNNAEAERILRRRARDLAQEQIRHDDEHAEALVVRVGHARYAIPLARLASVVGLDALTPLPGAPGFVAGLTQIQGHVVTIIDLGVLLGAAPEPPGAALIVEVDSGTFGLGVSAYERVIPVPTQGLEAVPPGLSETASRYIEGVVASLGVGVLKLSSVIDDLMELESGEEEP